MNNKLIKVMGIAASAIGVVATITMNWVNEKNLDNKITEKVAEALAKASEKN